MKSMRIEISETAHMDTYILDGNKKRKTVVICPGGGYTFVSPREGEPVALQFTSIGYNAFVLYYTVPPKIHSGPLSELSRAVCIVRENADQWGIDCDKIAVAGFSAGGHLAASLGVFWDSPEYCTNGLNRPNALILGYPLISVKPPLVHVGSFENLVGKELANDFSEKYSLEDHINDKTPPTFLWHTQDDDVVLVEHSLLFAAGLRKYNIPWEMHVFHTGKHGLSIGTAETDEYFSKDLPHHSSIWVDLCKRWLEKYL